MWEIKRADLYAYIHGWGMPEVTKGFQCWNWARGAWGAPEAYQGKPNDQNPFYLQDYTRWILDNPECGVNVPTRALRCQQCAARARAETLRERRAKSLPSGHVALSPRESGGIRWKAQAPAYPCATCKYGEASSESDSGWECLLLMAGRCRPWGEALFRTER